MFQQSRLFYLLVTVLVLLVFYLSGPFAAAKATPIKRFSNADARLSRWIEVMSPPRRSLPLQHFYDHPYTSDLHPFQDQTRPVTHIKLYPLGTNQLNRAEYFANHQKVKEAAPKSNSFITAPIPAKAAADGEVPDEFNEEVVKGSHRAAAAANPFQAAAAAQANTAVPSVDTPAIDADAPNPDDLVVTPRIDDYSAPFIRLLPQAAPEAESTASEEADTEGSTTATLSSSAGLAELAQEDLDDRTALDVDTTEAAAVDEGLKGHSKLAPEIEGPYGARTPAVDVRAPGEAEIAPIAEDHAAVKAPAIAKAQAAARPLYVPAAAKGQADAKAAGARPVVAAPPAGPDKRDPAANHPDALRNPLAEKIPSKGKIGRVASPAEVKGAPLIREPYTETMAGLPWAKLDADPAQVIENQVLPTAEVVAPIAAPFAAQAPIARKRRKLGSVSEEDV